MPYRFAPHSQITMLQHQPVTWKFFLDSCFTIPFGHLAVLLLPSAILLVAISRRFKMLVLYETSTGYAVFKVSAEQKCVVPDYEGRLIGF